VRQIQPIVLTFRGTEACVPLRLTAIAANPTCPCSSGARLEARRARADYYELQIDEARVGLAEQRAATTSAPRAS